MQEKGLECWQKSCMQKQCKPHVSALHHLPPMPHMSALREWPGAWAGPGTTALTVHYFTGNNAPLYLLFPLLEHTAPRVHAGSRNQLSRQQTPMPWSVILWNGGERNTSTSGKHPAFCDCGTNGPRWAGQANSLSVCLWISFPYTRGMCICMHTFMHTVYMYMHIHSSFLWLAGYS